MNIFKDGDALDKLKDFFDNKFESDLEKKTCLLRQRMEQVRSRKAHPRMEESQSLNCFALKKEVIPCPNLFLMGRGF
jgi:hypothetical protein